MIHDTLNKFSLIFQTSVCAENTRDMPIVNVILKSYSHTFRVKHDKIENRTRGQQVVSLTFTVYNLVVYDDCCIIFYVGL